MNYEDVVEIIGFDILSEVYDVDFSTYQTDEEKIEKALEVFATQNNHNKNLEYGQEFEISNEENSYLPDKNSSEGYTVVQDLKFTDSYIDYLNFEDELISNEDTMTLLMGTEDQMAGWLATTYEEALVSRDMDPENTYIEYGIFYTLADLNTFYNSTIAPYQLYFSNNQLPSGGAYSGCGIRPVVTISNETHFLGGDGTSDSPYEIDGEVKEAISIEANEVSEEYSNSVNNNDNSSSNNDKLYNGTLEVGNYTLQYGEYTATEGQYTDDRGVVSYEVTVTLRNDGTYILESSDNDILKDSNGTYEVKELYGETGIELSSGNFYAVRQDNSFSVIAGSGTTYTYKGK